MSIPRFFTAAPVFCAGAAAVPADPEETVCVDVPNEAVDEPAVVFPLELPVGVGLASTLAANLSTPAVTVTGKVVTSPSSPPFSYVTVLLPGKFADVPPALSLHTAFDVWTTQSCVAVKSFSPGTFGLLEQVTVAEVQVGNAPSYRRDRWMAHMSLHDAGRGHILQHRTGTQELIRSFRAML